MALTAALTVGVVLAQRNMPPANHAPNPYMTLDGWAKLPEGREWGSTAGVDIDPDGVHIWAIDRCGGNTCAEFDIDPVLKFDAAGNVVTSFGGGLMIFPHGMHVDAEGNVWVTDGQGLNGTDPNRDGQGHVVLKFSPTGKLLMTLGTPGVAGAGEDTFNQPSDVVVGPDDNIYVGDGHVGRADAPPDTNARIVKFAPDGTYLREWGHFGTGPGDFRVPHALAFDSQGRLVVGDRDNDRLQIFDTDGTFIEELHGYGAPSGLFITDDDTVYVAHSAPSEDAERGIRIGHLREGSVVAHIGGSNPEGVAVADDGTVYGAVVAYGGALL